MAKLYLSYLILTPYVCIPRINTINCKKTKLTLSLPWVLCTKTIYQGRS